ncbi:glycosyl transferase, family 2 [Rubellimicrobium mesophilum DSM 19309]|uniref:Glycosyl transferase, family 2 n=1 Tax=Rubellimicrobium mesophilum DSM 19309 TaxID=442562 RepID=A0A017HIH7_9RHOB|nr:glycosyltransferase family 2 protein [Rubellimicrobium mesophilum]EYD73958.1 glycosyl transferase, family 2 [Rubellimicrobium mesophilum DSM 19309]
MAPHVHVLMATWNGAAHLREQLASFEAQTHGDWSLWVSDDGSTDGTGPILADYAAARPGRVHLFEGPRRGSAANFLSLMARAELPEGIVALADQDDVWLPHRLERGLSWLGQGDGRPTVYASRTIRVTEDLEPLGPSIDHRREPVFANALVQNILAGNTLILDGAALRLLRRTVPAALGAGVRHHDWWVYLVASGAGARIAIDPEPGVLYRQHEGNHMGAHRDARGALARLQALRGGVWNDWADRNGRALEAAGEVLTPEARALLGRFQAIRSGTRGVARARALRAAGIHRQSRRGDAILAAMAALGWM